MQCSLVCKAWVPSSSIHLFPSFEWPPCESRFGPICPSQHPDEPCIPTFESLLLSSPRICASIRKLRFGRHRINCLEHHGLARRWDFKALLEPNEQTLANFSSLSRALLSFPRLSHLDIWAHFDESSTQPSQSHLALEELKVRLMVKTSINPVLAFLTTFRQIGRLDFQVSVETDEETPSPSSNTFPPLTSPGAVDVDFLAVGSPGKLTALHTAINPHAIRTLELRLPPTKHMLQHMCNLHTLRICLASGESAHFSSMIYAHGVGTRLGLISISCYLGPCAGDTSTVYTTIGDWGSAMGDLQELSNETTTSLFIEVLRTTDGSPLGRDTFGLEPEEMVVGVDRIEGALEALDWQRLEGVVRAYPALDHLELHFHHDLCEIGSYYGPEDAPVTLQRAKQCAQLLERVARRRLSARVVGRIPMTVRATINLTYDFSFMYTEAIVIT